MRNRVGEMVREVVLRWRHGFAAPVTRTNMTNNRNRSSAQNQEAADRDRKENLHA